MAPVLDVIIGRNGEIHERNRATKLDLKHLGNYDSSCFRLCMSDDKNHEA
jgi:hypothetical protein